MTRKMPFIVGIGGIVHDGSSTEQALALALQSAARCGAETHLFGGAKLAVFGAGINTSAPVFEGGECDSEDVRRQLELVGRQVCEFALLQADLPGRRGGQCPAARKLAGSQSDNPGEE